MFRHLRSRGRVQRETLRPAVIVACSPWASLEMDVSRPSRSKDGKMTIPYARTYSSSVQSQASCSSSPDSYTSCARGAWDSRGVSGHSLDKDH